MYSSAYRLYIYGRLKGTVSEDFLALFYFINPTYLGSFVPWDVCVVLGTLGLGTFCLCTKFVFVVIFDFLTKLFKNVDLCWNSYSLYIFFYILYEGMERPAQTKLMTAKLRAVLACAESLISQISPRKFKRNNFNLGPRWVGLMKLKMQKISWHCHFKQRSKNILFCTAPRDLL